MTPRRCIVTLVFALFAALPLVAQDEAVAESAADVAAEDGATVDGEPDAGPDMEEIDEMLEAEEELAAGGGYSYDPRGRRDPFLSLLRRQQFEGAERQRPPGVPGLLIDEIDIKGIFSLDGHWFAQVQTADKEKSYLVESGDQLFDGEVVAIAANEIIFKQVVNDPSIIKPFREVVKKLNPEP